MHSFDRSKADFGLSAATSELAELVASARVERSGEMRAASSLRALFASSLVSEALFIFFFFCLWLPSLKPKDVTDEKNKKYSGPYKGRRERK